MSQSLRFALLFGVLCFTPASAQDIVAHRGASGDAPENTLAAFRLAWKQGADAIEGDFQLTRDGRIVCIHDKDTQRTTSKKLLVAESTLGDLRQLEYGSWKHKDFAGEPIPTLPEVLTTVPDGKHILIEIKCGKEIVPALGEVLSDCPLKRDQLRIICFDAGVVAACKKAMPEIKAYWLTGFSRRKTTGEWAPSMESILQTLRRIRADGLDCRGDLKVLTPSFVEPLRDARFEFHTWTVNDVESAAKLRDLGVDSITTDYPGRLRQELVQARKRQAAPSLP